MYKSCFHLFASQHIDGIAWRDLARVSSYKRIFDLTWNPIFSFHMEEILYSILEDGPFFVRYLMATNGLRCGGFMSLFMYAIYRLR